MILSKKVRGKRVHRQHVLICTLVTLAVLAAMVGRGAAAGKPATVAELALYMGADRRQILEEGAKKEGKLTLYTTGTQAQYIVKAFEKKYPFVKVEVWRAGTRELIAKILEEYRAKKSMADVIGNIDESEIVFQEAGLLQPFDSPEVVQLEEGTIVKAPGGGVFSAGHFQSGRGIGYNTKAIKKEDLPKTYQDLLNPKWKGKLPIASEGGIVWMGCLLATFGEEFVRNIAKQDFIVQMMSARALNDMIVAGEYAFSPTISDSHVAASRKEGAPIDWLPLEPVASNLGQISIQKDAQHPYAAMLFIDFDLSREAGEIYKEQGYNSPRKDVANLRNYKKYFGFKSTKEVKEVMSLYDKLFMKK